MTTHESYSHLLGLMARQADYMRLMVATQERQRTALVHFTAADLQIATDEQARLSHQLRLLEKERLEFVAQLLQCSHEQALTMSSTDIAAQCPEEFHQQFLVVRDDMKSLMKQLQFLNGMNRMLNERARRFTQAVIGVISPHGQSLYNRRV